MSFLAIAILLMSIEHCFCDTRNCTRDERCLLVDASVCDNSKCLLLNKTDIDETVRDGVKLYAFNINRAVFVGFCPMSVKYEQPANCDGNSTINAIYTLHSGPGCTESTTVTTPFIPDPDPEKTGQIRLLTSYINGDKYEECYTYFEKDKAYVLRRCLVDPNLPAGKACAAIFARMVATENCTSPGLAAFVKDMNINLPQKSVDCL